MCWGVYIQMWVRLGAGALSANLDACFARNSEVLPSRESLLRSHNHPSPNHPSTQSPIQPPTHVPTHRCLHQSIYPFFYPTPMNLSINLSFTLSDCFITKLRFLCVYIVSASVSRVCVCSFVSVCSCECVCACVRVRVCVRV